MSVCIRNIHNVPSTYIAGEVDGVGDEYVSICLEFPACILNERSGNRHLAVVANAFEIEFDDSLAVRLLGPDRAHGRAVIQLQEWKKYIARAFNNYDLEIAGKFKIKNDKQVTCEYMYISQRNPTPNRMSPVNYCRYEGPYMRGYMNHLRMQL